MTIAEAAAEVLRSSKKPLSLAEIVAGITKKDLYAFNSPDQLSIVREQVRRHCFLPHKTLQYQPTLFVQLIHNRVVQVTAESAEHATRIR